MIGADYGARARLVQAVDHAPAGRRGGAVWDVHLRASGTWIGTVRSYYHSRDGVLWLAYKPDDEPIRWVMSQDPQDFTTRRAAVAALVRNDGTPNTSLAPAPADSAVPDGWLAIVSESAGGVVGYLDPAHADTVRSDLAPKGPPL